MAKTKEKQHRKGRGCVNHSNNFETKECERCHEYFCPDCYIEDWSVNFFQQFVGQKRNFVKKIYCKPCRNRVIRIRMIAYLGLLILFGGPVVLWLISAILFQI